MEVHLKIINGSCIDLRGRREKNAAKKSEYSYPSQLGLGAGDACMPWNQTRLALHAPLRRPIRGISLPPQKNGSNSSSIHTILMLSKRPVN